MSRFLIIIFFIIILFTGCKQYIHTYEVYQNGKCIGTKEVNSFESKGFSYESMFDNIYYKYISTEKIK
jgi:PBP1b-binding outer membrane lipoprotein LpoB